MNVIGLEDNWVQESLEKKRKSLAGRINFLSNFQK